jgi:hypothetical protein
MNLAFVWVPSSEWLEQTEFNRQGELVVIFSQPAGGQDRVLTTPTLLLGKQFLRFSNAPTSSSAKIGQSDARFWMALPRAPSSQHDHASRAMPDAGCWPDQTQEGDIHRVAAA